MHSSSSSIITSFCSKFIIFIFIFNLNFPFTISAPLIPTLNITLFGDAYFIKDSKTNIVTSIRLTKHHPSSVGRAFYKFPLQFLDSSTNSTFSFACNFSFTITQHSVSTPGDGIAFLITSEFGKIGHLGMPEFSLKSQDSFFAVEFDTKFDAFDGDINGNHVGVDLNSCNSLVSVDGFSSGVDFGNGKRVTVWIEYKNSVKMIKVWVSYLPNKPLSPVISAHIDLSMHMKEKMYVGFSAANGNGSAVHVIHGWEFETFEFEYSSVNKVEEAGDYVNCTAEVVSDGDSKKVSKKVDGTFVGIIFGLSLSIVLVLAYLIWRLWKIRVSSREDKRRIELEKRPAKLYLSEVRTATNGFSKSRIIGEGSSATIYKGILFHNQIVAVKRFNNINKGNLRKRFTIEFATMAQSLKHKNLVELLGWCCEKNELILVYEFMPNGSLDQILHNNSDDPHCGLTWEQRVHIVIGIASCLTYLHEECKRQIIHRDVKTCNVMLDSNFTPKLGDFGLAEVYDKESTLRKPTIPAGTMGYLAPEYVYSGVPTVKSDVYSFGVVILEVVSGRRPVEDDRTMLVDWMWTLCERGKLIEAVDPRMMGRYSMAEMERMLKVGLCCVHFDKKKRPTIKEASMMLRGELQLPVLPFKRPVVKLDTVLPRASKKILMNYEGDDDFSECLWSSPKTHFSEDELLLF